MTDAAALPAASSSTASSVGPLTECPFHDGAATLDLLLGELSLRDTELFDAALDLRSLATARTDARACLEQFFRVRALLGDQHYLAFFRVRCWARHAFQVSARRHRNAPWISLPLPLDCARLDEVVNSLLSEFTDADGILSPSAHVRFEFTSLAAAT